MCHLGVQGFDPQPHTWATDRNSKVRKGDRAQTTKRPSHGAALEPCMRGTSHRVYFLQAHLMWRTNRLRRSVTFCAHMYHGQKGGQIRSDSTAVAPGCCLLCLDDRKTKPTLPGSTLGEGFRPQVLRRDPNHQLCSNMYTNNFKLTRVK